MAVGTATLNFGSAPGTNFVTTIVTGQTAIAADSKVEAYMMSASTAEHNEYEHIVAPIKLTCSNVIAGVGFTINAVTDWRLTGTFTVNWVWA